MNQPLFKNKTVRDYFNDSNSFRGLIGFLKVRKEKESKVQEESPDEFFTRIDREIEESQMKFLEYRIELDRKKH